MASGLAIAPPRVKIVCHCFTARGAGACIAAGMPTTERHTLDPSMLVSHAMLYNVYEGFSSLGMRLHPWRNLPSKNTLPVMPTACAIASAVGVLCVSRLSIVWEYAINWCWVCGI